MFRKKFAYLKEFFWVSIGSIVGFLSSIWLVKLLTYNLDSTIYGILGLILTISTLFTQVFLVSIPIVGNRFYSIHESSNTLKQFYTDLIQIAVIVLYLLLAFLVIAIIIVLLFFDNTWVAFILLAALNAGLVIIYSSITGILIAGRRRKEVSIITCMEAILKIGSIYFFLKWMGGSISSVMIAYIFSTFILLILACTFIITQKNLLELFCIPDKVFLSPKRIPFKNLKSYWIYLWPILFSGIFNWLYNSSPRWILEILTTTNDLGQFVAISQISSSPISTAGSVLISFITPILFLKAGNLSSNASLMKVVGILKLIFVIGAALIIIAFLATKIFVNKGILFSFFLDESYRDYMYLVPLLVLYSSILQLSYLISSYFQIILKTKPLLYLNSIGNILFIFIYAILTYYLGVEGLVYGLVVSAIIHLSYILIITNKHNGLRQSKY